MRKVERIYIAILIFILGMLVGAIFQLFWMKSLK